MLTIRKEHPKSMLEKRTVLIVCHEIKDLTLLKKYKPKPDHNYVFASDDLWAQSKIREYPWVNEGTALENLESIHTVGEDVICLEDTINEWLHVLSGEGRGFPSDLLFFLRHVEGGVTNQRIQDALLLIRSYLRLIDTFLVNEVILLRDSKSIWEDDVFVQTAKSKRIRIRELGKVRPRIMAGRIKYWAKSFAYEPYYLLNYLVVKSSNLTRKRRIPQRNEVIVQLCSSMKKHTENVGSILESLDREKYCPVALCWNAGLAKELRKQGIHVDHLEEYISLHVWIKSFVKMVWTVTKLYREKSSFLNRPELCYLSVRLNHLLWYSVCHLVIAEMGNRYRLMKAATCYFHKHAPVAISPWGMNDLVEGRITLKSINSNCSPMLFKFHLSMVLFQSPYRLVYEPVDLYLVGGPYQRDFNVHTLGKPIDRIEMVGQTRYNGLNEFMKNFKPSSSLTYLGIPLLFSRYVLFDLNASIRGYISKAELMLVLSVLIEMMKKRDKVALLIKPHPGAEGYDYRVPDGTNNVFLLQRDMLPYHALNCSDLLITKFSTLGIEAMLFSKPVVSIILDNEKQWEVYQDAADYFHDTEAMVSLLDKILEDGESFEHWREGHLEKQRKFLAYCFGDSMKNSSLLTAQAIDKHLSYKRKRLMQVAK